MSLRESFQDVREWLYFEEPTSRGLAMLAVTAAIGYGVADRVQARTSVKKEIQDSSLVIVVTGQTAKPEASSIDNLKTKALEDSIEANAGILIGIITLADGLAYTVFATDMEKHLIKHNLKRKF